MNALEQVVAATEMGLRSVPQRLGASLVVIVGVAVAVGVFITVLALATSFAEVSLGTGRADRVVILSKGTDSEIASGVSREDLQAISRAPGIRRADGSLVLSPEAMVIAQLVDPRDGYNVFMALRGVGAQLSKLRPEIRVVEGRMFEPGKQELIVGHTAAERLDSLAVGNTLSLPQGEWKIVGRFTSNGDSHESELLTDVETLVSAYRRFEYNSVVLSLESAGHFALLRDALIADPALSVTPEREDQYFLRRSAYIEWLMRAIAFGVGVIMALGAAFGALNTMYSAVSNRQAEIATLRAIGFDGISLMCAILIESLILALAGAVLGAGLAWLLFNGASVSTLTGTSPSQLTFALHITPDLIFSGILGACVIGVAGGLFPAVRAGSVPVVMAARDA